MKSPDIEFINSHDGKQAIRNIVDNNTEIDVIKKRFKEVKCNNSMIETKSNIN